MQRRSIRSLIVNALDNIDFPSSRPINYVRRPATQTPLINITITITTRIYSPISRPRATPLGHVPNIHNLHMRIPLIFTHDAHRVAAWVRGC